MRHRLVLSVVDLSLIGLATICAQLLRDSFDTRPDQILALLPYLGLSLATAIPALAVFKLNQTIWRLSGMADYLSILGVAVLIVTSAVGLGFLVNRLEGVARSLPVIQAYLIVFGLVGVRVIVRLRHAGRGKPLPAPESPLGEAENILVVGVNVITELYLRSVNEFSAGRIRIMGLLAASNGQTGRLVQRHKILGSPEQIASVLGDLQVHGVPISRVVVTLPVDDLSAEARAALQEVEESCGIRVEFLAEQICIGERAKPSASASSAPTQGTEAEFPRVDRLDVLAPRPYWRVKRVLDVAAAMCAIVMLLPLLLLVATLAIMDVGRPAIFWQQRPGAGGRPFRLYKIRTMAMPYDAEGRRIPDADRLSGLGRLLRRFHFDELPQVFNILIGEMSFIGPRPLLLSDHLPGFDARLAVRPGLTGWAQVKGGRSLSAADKAALDVWYIRNACLRVDLEILVGTLRVILFGDRTADADAIREAWCDLRSNTAGDARQAGASAPHWTRAHSSA